MSNDKEEQEAGDFTNLLDLGEFDHQDDSQVDGLLDHGLGPIEDEVDDDLFEEKVSENSDIITLNDGIPELSDDLPDLSGQYNLQEEMNFDSTLPNYDIADVTKSSVDFTGVHTLGDFNLDGLEGVDSGEGDFNSELNIMDDGDETEVPDLSVPDAPQMQMSPELSEVDIPEPPLEENITFKIESTSTFSNEFKNVEDDPTQAPDFPPLEESTIKTPKLGTLSQSETETEIYPRISPDREPIEIETPSSTTEVIEEALKQAEPQTQSEPALFDEPDPPPARASLKMTQTELPSQGLTQTHFETQTPFSSPQLPEYKQEGKEYFEDVEKDLEQVSYAESVGPQNPSYGLVLDLIRPEHGQEILKTLDQVGLLKDEDLSVYERSIHQGKMLINHISEYAAITMVNKLRPLGLDFKLGLPDEIYQSESNEKDRPLRGYTSSFNHDDHDYGHFLDGHFPMATTQRIEGFEILRYLGIITSIEIVDEKTLISETPHSPFGSMAYDHLAKKLIPKARNCGANAVLGIQFAFTPKNDFTSVPQYQVTCSGSAVLVKPIKE